MEPARVGLGSGKPNSRLGLVLGVALYLWLPADMHFYNYNQKIILNEKKARNIIQIKSVWVIASMELTAGR